MDKNKKEGEHEEDEIFFGKTKRRLKEPRTYRRPTIVIWLQKTWTYTSEIDDKEK